MINERDSHPFGQIGVQRLFAAHNGALQHIAARNWTGPRQRQAVGSAAAVNSDLEVLARAGEANIGRMIGNLIQRNTAY
jgi:hypothetical protein